MRIGILLPSIFASKKYGEGRIFAPGDLAISLADELVKRGHDVYLYTSRDVQTQAHVIPGNPYLTDQEPTYFQFRYRDALEQKYSTAEIVKRDFEYELTKQAYKDARNGKLDIIHSYHDFGAHYFNEITGFPTVYTLHDPMPQSEHTIEYHRFKQFGHHQYISISNAQRKSVVPLNFVQTIYHGIHLDRFVSSEVPGEYLMYFGRVMEDKGPDVAIDVAKQLGIPIKIATSAIRANRSASYYDTKIAPQIDGTMVSEIGFLTGKAMSDFIGHAKAFLFPLHWDEPFGMVMIESMACGTPVVAYNHGSVPEIVQDGVTGFIVDEDDSDRPGKGSWVIKTQGIAGLKEAVGRLGELSRAACRRRVEESFTVEHMAEQHEEVYKKILHIS